MIYYLFENLKRNFENFRIWKVCAQLTRSPRCFNIFTSESNFLLVIDSI